MCNPTFDVESSYLVPHPLVRYENYEALLKGKPITVIVHLLVQVHGTNESNDYDKKWVCAPAVVWLDSSNVRP